MSERNTNRNLPLPYTDLHDVSSSRDVLSPPLRTNAQQSRVFSNGLRRGQALLELSLVIPIIIVLIGATISIGLFMFQGNVLQQAVDVAAQEIARMPFAPEQELGLGRLDKCQSSDLACEDTLFKNQIYDEQYLVIDDTEWDHTTPFNGDFRAFADQLPLLNRLIVPTMIRDNQMTRYPGTIVVNSQTGEKTVLIPIVEYRVRDSGEPLPFPNNNPSSGGFMPSTVQAAGETIVKWVAPVEEIRVDHDNDASTPLQGPYPLLDLSETTLPSFQPGMVAIRINYPAQSTTMLNRIDLDDSVANPDGRRGGIIVLAGDTVIDSENDFSSCYVLDTPTPRISPGSGQPGSNPNAGAYGLGELEALTRVVRPYRKVMTFQAIYRREVFGLGDE